MTQSTNPHRRALRLVVALLVAVAMLPTALPAATSATTPVTRAAACAGINLRARATTTSRSVVRLAISTKVTVSGTVKGSSWRVVCPGVRRGTTWYRITAVNGRSVRSRYGVSYLYAATGVLTTVKPAKPSPTPSPTPTPTPSPSSSPAPPSETPSASLSASPSASADPSAAPSAAPTPTPKPTPSPTATPSPTPVPNAPTPIKASVTFYGRGWGHGVGLSQYGARGRALGGQSAGDILAHYYQGTTIGTLAEGGVIRVALLQSFAATASQPLVIDGRGGPWTIDGIDATFPADARLRVIPTVTGSVTTWRLVVRDAAGKALASATAAANVWVRATDPATLQLTSKATTRNRYRGAFHVILGKAATVIDVLPLEMYLRGVVPSEMPASWPIAALGAQAVAARSYAAYRIRPGTSTFDVYDDTRSQVYGGVVAERVATDSAIAATANQVLKSGNAIANALYHSTAGGATENNENVFVSATGARVAGVVSYLRGSPDRRPDGTAWDSGAPYATWRTRTYTRAALSAIFAADARTKVGTLSALDLRNRGVSGRLVSVTLIGSAGKKTVSGEVFMAVFNAGRPAADAPLRSTLLALAPIP